MRASATPHQRFLVLSLLLVVKRGGFPLVCPQKEAEKSGEQARLYPEWPQPEPFGSAPARDLRRRNLSRCGAGLHRSGGQFGPDRQAATIQPRRPVGRLDSRGAPERVCHHPESRRLFAHFGGDP